MTDLNDDIKGDMSPQRLPWPEWLERAAVIVHSDDTGGTLRQSFDRLVAVLRLPNPTNAYTSLSKHTAEGS